MRWLQTVGLVRWGRNHPELKETLSGGVGLVRWCRIGLWDFPWDFLNGNRVRVHVAGPRQHSPTGGFKNGLASEALVFCS